MKPSVNTFAGDVHHSILSYPQGVEHPTTQPPIEKSSICIDEKARGTSEKVRGTFLNDNDNHLTPQLLTANSRFIADPVQAALDAGYRWIAIKSDMNTGKTHMLALQLMKQDKGDVSIIVVHLASLNRGTAKRLERTTKEKGVARKVTNYTDLTPKSAADADAVTTTYNNLPNVLKLLTDAGRKINIVAFDESESGAQFMARGTITNKGQAGEAIQQATSKAKIVLLMDAHLAAGSSAFAAAFMPDLEFTQLVNEYSVWADHTYDWVEGRAAGVSLAAEYIKAGKPVFIACTSAELAAKIRVALEEQGLLKGKRVLDAFHDKMGADSKELVDAKADNSLFKLYDVVIASPTVGTGVSIEGIHFETVIAFMVCDKDAPDAVASMQLPFRVRDMRSQHIHMVRVDQSDRGKPLTPWEVRKDAKAYMAAKDALICANMEESDRQKVLRAMAGLHSAYTVELDEITHNLFSQYYAVIDEEFALKGIKRVSPPALHENAALSESLKTAGSKLEELTNTRKIEADDIDDEQAAAIAIKLKFDRASVTADDIASHEKHKLVKSYHDDTLPPPTPDQIREYIGMAADGIATGRNNGARALMLLPEINLLQKAYFADETFGRDIADNKDVRVKTFWKLDRVLCSVAGVALDSEHGYRLTTKEKRVDVSLLNDKANGQTDYSYKRMVSEIVDEYNSLKPEKRIVRPALHENPVEVFRWLIESRLKLRTAKIRGEDAFVICDEQPVIDNMNMMRKRGSFGDLLVLDIVTAKAAVDESGEFTEEVKKRVGIDTLIQRFVSKCLEHIPARNHKRTIAEYLRRAEMPRAEGDNFTALARANQWLLDAAGIKGVDL